MRKLLAWLKWLLSVANFRNREPEYPEVSARVTCFGKTQVRRYQLVGARGYHLIARGTDGHGMQMLLLSQVVEGDRKIAARFYQRAARGKVRRINT